MFNRSAHNSTHYLNPLHSTSLKMSETGALYFTHTIRGFAVSLVGIFLPLYIYTLSASHLIFSPDVIKNGITWILIYYLLASVSTLGVLFGLVNYIFTKITFRIAIILSLITMGIEIWFWLLAQKDIRFLLFSGLVSGITTMFYWVPYHISFVRANSRHDGNFGRSVGLRVLLITIVGGIGPLLGGLVITKSGFSVLFLISLFLLLASGLPIFLSTSEKKHSSHNIVKVIKFFIKKKKFINSSISFFGTTLEEVIFGIFWALLLYLTMHNFANLGLLRSVGLIFSALVVLFAGKYIDTHGTKRIHFVGVFFNTLFYIPRIFTNVPLYLYSLEFADKINGVFYSLPLLSRLYKLGEDSNISDFILYREFVIHFSKVIILLFLLVFVYLYSWRMLFVLGLIGSLLSYFIEFDVE